MENFEAKKKKLNQAMVMAEFVFIIGGMTSIYTGNMMIFALAGIAWLTYMVSFADWVMITKREKRAKMGEPKAEGV